MDWWRTSLLNQRRVHNPSQVAKAHLGFKAWPQGNLRDSSYPKYLQTHSPFLCFHFPPPPVLKFYAFPFFFWLCIEIIPHALYVVKAHLILPTTLYGTCCHRAHFTDADIEDHGLKKCGLAHTPKEPEPELKSQPPCLQRLAGTHPKKGFFPSPLPTRQTKQHSDLSPVLSVLTA